MWRSQVKKTYIVPYIIIAEKIHSKFSVILAFYSEAVFVCLEA